MSEYCKECYKKQEEIEELKAELKKYEDMAQKGLDEFKDVGGCWGCGLQLQLNQDMEDIKKLKAENEELKKKIEDLNFYIDSYRQTWEVDKYRKALQEIREIVSEPCIVDENCQTCNSGCMQKDILIKINEVLGGE